MSALKICTEVAGTVWKIVAAPGATLAAGQEILIMESMKMEIPVEAPRAGRLLELRVAEGNVLKEGDVVALMD